MNIAFVYLLISCIIRHSSPPGAQELPTASVYWLGMVLYSARRQYQALL